MKRIKEILASIIGRYGAIVASCAFVAVVIAANSSCSLPYYEPEEPDGLEKYKKL
jgi:cyclic lactone autoinducer peptide